MSTPVDKPATYQYLLDLPEYLVGEIIHRRLVTHRCLAPKQALAHSAIGAELSSRFRHGRDGPGGWWILDKPELRLDSDVLVPDLGGWQRERLPKLSDIAYFTLPPDWVCEVLSPSTARVDRADKMPIYAAQGIPFLWLIDPDLHTLEVFLLNDGRWMLENIYQENDPVSAPAV